MNSNAVSDNGSFSNSLLNCENRSLLFVLLSTNKMMASSRLADFNEASIIDSTFDRDDQMTLSTRPFK